MPYAICKEFSPGHLWQLKELKYISNHWLWGNLQCEPSQKICQSHSMSHNWKLFNGIINFRCCFVNQNRCTSSPLSDSDIRHSPWGEVEEEDMSALLHRRGLEKRMNALIWDVCHQMLFLCCTLALCYSNQDTDVFRQNESLKSNLLTKIELVSNRSCN